MSDTCRNCGEENDRPGCDVCSKSGFSVRKDVGP